MSLSDLLCAKRELLIERWCQRMEPLIAPRVLSREDLVDSMPVFLEEIAGALRRDEGRPSDSQLPQRSRVAEAHGLQRLGLGFEVELIPQEYKLAEDCFLELLEEAGHPLVPRQARLLSGCLQTATAEAVSQYVQATHAREQRLLEESRARQASLERALADLRRSDAALRASEERFSLMVSSVLDYAVFMLSVDGVVSGWNPGAERLKRYKAEEIIGTNYDVFFLPEQRERKTGACMLEKAARTGSAEYEGWLLRKDQSRFWGTLIINPMRDDTGKLQGFSNVARNLTERKQAEDAQSFLAGAGEALAGSLDYQQTLEEATRLALDAVADGCVVWIREGEALRPRVVAHREEEKETLARRVLRPLPVDGPASHGPVSVLRTGRSQGNRGVPLPEMLGIEDPQALETLGGHGCLCVPLRARGEAFGVMTFMAATPERELDPVRSRLAEEFARRVALALENARLYGEMIDRTELEQHLAGIVSHDLNTPLQAIGLGARSLLKDATLTEHQRRTLERIQGSAERVHRMTRDLLDFTQARLGGTLKVRPAPMDLHALARGAVEELAAAAPGRTVEHVHSGDGAGEWDSDRLAQLLTNLVNNALTYSAPELPVQVETRGEDDSVWIHVRGGRPIPAHVLSKLFRPLERGDVREGGRGIGLGLFIVDHIVRAHGGKVTVHSTEAEGTTVSVRLPRHRPQ